MKKEMLVPPWLSFDSGCGNAGALGACAGSDGREKANSAAPCDAVVCTAGSGVNALAVVRSLGRLGLRVTVVAEGSSNLATRSRYCSNAVIRPEWQTAELVDTLLDLRRHQQRKPMLFIDNDRMLSRLSHADAGVGAAFQLTSPLGRENRFNDKLIQWQVAERLGVKVPRQWRPLSWTDLAAICREADGPVIAKPLRQTGDGAPSSYKVILGHDPGQLERELCEAGAEPDACLIQEYIDGPDDNLRWAMGYRSGNGGCHLATGVKWRQTGSGAGGVGSVMLSLRDAQVEAQSRRFLEGLGYQGIFGVEFKYSASTGELFFIEMNARPEAFHALGSRIGVDPPVLAYRDLMMGEELSDVRQEERPVFWISAGADLIQILKGRARLDLRHAMRPYLSRKQWAVCDVEDLMPWLHATGTLARDLFGRTIKRREKP